MQTGKQSEIFNCIDWFPYESERSSTIADRMSQQWQTIKKGKNVSMHFDQKELSKLGSASDVWDQSNETENTLSRMSPRSRWQRVQLPNISFARSCDVAEFCLRICQGWIYFHMTFFPGCCLHSRNLKPLVTVLVVKTRNHSLNFCQQCHVFDKWAWV